MTTPSIEKIRILVLGGTGMLGHKLVQRLAARHLWVATTIRSSAIPDSPAARATLGKADRILGGVDVLQGDQLGRAIDAAEPDVVVNAVGVIKQIKDAKDPIVSISTNALLPHRVAALCARRGVRLIHFSTDCVFSGRNGPYAEDASPDPQDLYGRSKLLGEPCGTRCLTIRTSIVGRELRGRASLIEWLISQRGGSATGYAGALYSGLTTGAIADLVGQLIVGHPDLDGLWHVSSDAISKYELLTMVNRHYRLGITLARDDKLIIDRRLDSSRFRARTGFSAANWNDMIAEMRADATPYDDRSGAQVMDGDK
jgi:dTDP-4-dehydrorhamnose reductase